MPWRAYAFLHLPLLILAVFSFNASRFTVWQGFSLQWYRGVASGSRPDRIRGQQPDHRARFPRCWRRLCGTLAAYALWKRASALALRVAVSVAGDA